MRPEDTPQESVAPTQLPEPKNTDSSSNITADKPIRDADNETDTSPFTPVSQTENSSVFNPTRESEPNHAPFAGAPTPVVSSGKSRSKKPLLIGIAAAVLAVLGGGYAAYAMWWNAPDKVVEDALASVVMAKDATAVGTLSFSSEGSPTFKMAFDSKTIDQKSQTVLDASTTVDGKEYKINAAVITDKDTYYVRMNDLKKTLNAIYGDAEVISMFDPIVSKIDGKWVVITPDDVKRLSGGETVSNKEMTCAQNVLGGIKSNKSQQNELATVYQKNRFIFVKESKGVESIDGKQSNHYVMGLNEDKAIAFGKALVDTSVFKSVDDCVSQDLKKQFLDENKKDDTSKSVTTTELWVDMWSHKPTKVKVTSDNKDSGKLTMESKFTFDSRVEVGTPKAETTVKDIETEINKLQQQFTVPTSEL